MIYRAYLSFTHELLALPETGMGYQLIEAQKTNSSELNKFIVYNSELIVELNSTFELNKRRIVIEGHSKLFENSDLIELKSPTVLKQFELKSESLLTERGLNAKGRKSGGKGAVDNLPINGNGVDVFVRLSAYENDRRVDRINKRLLTGTYTTTLEDYLVCKNTNDDPVDRYALPNDEEIKWAFYVRPKSYDMYRPGIVQPANGHSGGGVEALFDNGTSNNTLFQVSEY